jgi:hypothetical protein
MAGGGYNVNRDLVGVRRFDTFDEMMRTDPSIKSLLMFIGLPIRSTTWGLNPGVDDDLGRMVCDFVAWNLGLGGQTGQLDLSWDELQQQALKALGYGCMFEELVWGDVQEWKDADGIPHIVRPLDRVAPRWPKTVVKARFERGRIAEVVQSISNTKPIVQTDACPKLSYITFDRDASGWGGTPIIRPAYGAWKIKKHLLVAAGIGWDRFASGLPAVWHPDNPDAEAKAKAIGRSIRQHERAYVHFPGRRTDGEWDIEILNAAQTLADPTPLLKYCTEQEAVAGMQQFTTLGTTDSGSRGVGEVQVDAFFQAVMATARHLKHERMRQVIKPLVVINFGAEVAETHLPELTIGRIQSRNIFTVSNALELLSVAGFTFTDRGAIDDIREMLGFPALPTELADVGISVAQLTQILQSLGLDSEQFAKIINALPPEIGVARNTVAEGSGLKAAGVSA